MPENTPSINQTDLNTLSTSAPTPSMVAAAPKPPKTPRNLLPLVIILAVLSCAGLGASIFFGIQTIAKDSELSDLKAQLEIQNPTVIIDENNSSTPSDVADQPNVATKADILAEVPKNLILNNHKCLNSTQYQEGYTLYMGGEGLTIYDESHHTNAFAFFTSYDSVNNQPELIINWDVIKNQTYPIYGITVTKSGTETITDFDLSGKVTDVLFASLSHQATGYEVLLFLMEDGSVEYLPLMKAFQNQNFHSYGKLKGIENVIKFYEGDASKLSSDSQAYMPGSFRDILAQRADGDYYSLFAALQATGNL